MNVTLGVCPDWVDMNYQEWIKLIHMSEELGYRYLWAPNEKFFRDMYVMATVMAERTASPYIGTFVADPYTHHPALTAMAIATLDQVSNGRAVLGIGAGGTGFSAMGLSRVKPALAIREAVHVIRSLLHGDLVNFEGEVIQINNGQMNFTGRSDIPIIIAGRGDKILEMAGEIADGVMISTYAEPSGIRHALSQVERGAHRARRNLEDIRLMSRIDVCIAADRREAVNALKPCVATLLCNSYPNTRFVDVAGLQMPEELERVIATRDYSLAVAGAHLVPDEFVERFCFTGTPDEVAGQARHMIEVGIDSITILPHAPRGGSVQATVREFALAMESLLTIR